MSGAETRRAGILAAKGSAAPLPSSDAAVEPAPRALRPAVARPAKVLVLATDRYSARVYHDLLEAGGYDPAVPRDIGRWAEALRDWRPDLVLVDPGPAGGPGMRTARAILQEPDFRPIPMIAITDRPDPEETAVLLAGCAGRIVKPISLSGFYAPIHAILARPSARKAEGRAESA